MCNYLLLFVLGRYCFCLKENTQFFLAYRIRIQRMRLIPNFIIDTNKRPVSNYSPMAMFAGQYRSIAMPSSSLAAASTLTLTIILSSAPDSKIKSIFCRMQKRNYKPRLLFHCCQSATETLLFLFIQATV